jgi:hypothetical protein
MGAAGQMGAGGSLGTPGTAAAGGSAATAVAPPGLARPAGAAATAASNIILPPAPPPPPLPGAPAPYGLRDMPLPINDPFNWPFNPRSAGVGAQTSNQQSNAPPTYSLTSGGSQIADHAVPVASGSTLLSNPGGNQEGMVSNLVAADRRTTMMASDNQLYFSCSSQALRLLLGPCRLSLPAIRSLPELIKENIAKAECRAVMAAGRVAEKDIVPECCPDLRLFTISGCACDATTLMGGQLLGQRPNELIIAARASQVSYCANDTFGEWVVGGACMGEGERWPPAARHFFCFFLSSVSGGGARPVTHLAAHSRLPSPTLNTTTHTPSGGPFNDPCVNIKNCGAYGAFALSAPPPPSPSGPTTLGGLLTSPPAGAAVKPGPAKPAAAGAPLSADPLGASGGAAKPGPAKPAAPGGPANFDPLGAGAGPAKPAAPGAPGANPDPLGAGPAKPAAPGGPANFDPLGAGAVGAGPAKPAAPGAPVANPDPLGAGTAGPAKPAAPGGPADFDPLGAGSASTQAAQDAAAGGGDAAAQAAVDGGDSQGDGDGSRHGKKKGKKRGDEKKRKKR